MTPNYVKLTFSINLLRKKKLNILNTVIRNVSRRSSENILGLQLTRLHNHMLFHHIKSCTDKITYNIKSRNVQSNYPNGHGKQT